VSPNETRRPSADHRARGEASKNYSRGDNRRYRTVTMSLQRPSGVRATARTNRVVPRFTGTPSPATRSGASYTGGNPTSAPPALRFLPYPCPTVPLDRSIEPRLAAVLWLLWFPVAPAALSLSSTRSAPSATMAALSLASSSATHEAGLFLGPSLRASPRGTPAEPSCRPRTTASAAEACSYI